MGNGEQNHKGILDSRALPDASFDALWDSIVLDSGIKDRLLSQCVLNFTLRGKVDAARVPLHGIMVLVGPPGTGKTSLGRGLASKTAKIFPRERFHYLEVEPHALAGAGLGKSQQSVCQLLGKVVAERAASGPAIVLLDEVESLAGNRAKMSMEANPVDVHRATDAVLAQLDQLASKFPRLLFIATSNFPEAIDSAFLSRADQIVSIGLPTAEACQSIVEDTVAALGEIYKGVAKLLKHHDMAHIGKACQGLDGRQIRKAVIAALTSSKELAIDPNGLSMSDIINSIRDAKKEKVQMQ